MLKDFSNFESNTNSDSLNYLEVIVTVNSRNILFSIFKKNVLLSHLHEHPFFSSPEHEVLMVSYWDSAVSVVRRPSSTFYLVYALEATVLVGYSRKLVRMFVSMKSRTSSKMGHVGSKTRSLGQILEKPCVRSRGHIFSRILMKVGQDVCLDDISDEFENGSRGVKN